MKNGHASAKQPRNLGTLLGSQSLELVCYGGQHRPLGLRLPLRVLNFLVKGFVVRVCSHIVSSTCFLSGVLGDPITSHFIHPLYLLV